MKKLFFWMVLLSHIKISAIIILVHGTFATKSKWCKPGGKFYNVLEQEAIGLNDKLQFFNWSGALNNIARIKAAKELAELILKLENEKIILIGHSFGGNVINLASKLMYHIEEIPAFSSFEDVAEFLQAYRDLAPLRKKKSSKNLIDMVYLLGTPIDLQQFPPNMYVIKNLCNLYSTNDKIQSVLGFYSKTFENVERSANLEIIIRDAEITSGGPNHHQMHHPIIASSILHIPCSFKEQKIGGFDLFNWNECGTIELSSDNPPLYTAKPKEVKPIEATATISHLSLWS